MSTGAWLQLAVFLALLLALAWPLARWIDAVMGGRFAVGRRLESLGFELFHEPGAGMYLWARHPDLPDSAELSKEATGAGIMLGPGQLFLEEPRPTGWLRFNVAFSQDERLWRFLEQRILLGQQAAE